jgi:transcriptional regulator with XRE-family HTH domain
MSNRTIDIDELKKRMIDAKIKTLSELAEKSGISRATLTNVFNEKQLPSSDTMYRLVECLEIPPAAAGQIFFRHNLRIA